VKTFGKKLSEPAEKKQRVEAKSSSQASSNIKYGASTSAASLLGGGESGSDSSSHDEVEVVTEETLQKQDEQRAKKDYPKVFKKWVKMKVDWKALYPNEDWPSGNLDVIKDLMKLDVGVLYKKLESTDPNRMKYGFLPLMASCSLGQLGALNAESYAERVNSMGKLVLMDANSLLSDKEVSMLVVLRMNEQFMQHMRTHYKKYLKQLERFGRTVIRNQPDPIAPCTTDDYDDC